MAPPLAAETAAVLALGPQAVLSHRTAAALWGLLRDPGPQIHLSLVDRRSPRSRPGIAVHRGTTLAARDLARRHGLPLTAPLRTLLDVATSATPRELGRAIAEAEVLRHFRREDLEAAVDDARPTGGRRVARRAPSEHPARANPLRGGGPLPLPRRPGGAPAPQVNVPVGGHEVDAFWRAHRLAVEVDGFAFHGSRAAFERDRRRDADLQARGVRVMRTTWRQIVDDPEALVARLAQALARSP